MDALKNNTKKRLLVTWFNLQETAYIKIFYLWLSLPVLYVWRSRCCYFVSGQVWMCWLEIYHSSWSLTGCYSVEVDTLEDPLAPCDEECVAWNWTWSQSRLYVMAKIMTLQKWEKQADKKKKNPRQLQNHFKMKTKTVFEKIRRLQGYMLFRSILSCVGGQYPLFVPWIGNLFFQTLQILTEWKGRLFIIPWLYRLGHLLHMACPWLTLNNAAWVIASNPKFVIQTKSTLTEHFPSL